MPTRKYAEAVKKEAVRLVIRRTCSIARRRTTGLRNMTQTEVASLEEEAASEAGGRFGLIIASVREAYEMMHENNRSSC
ncbi:hypothetical protein [Paenibacillus sp. MDMC362]|uniref:hypothetical protein n=1 Tax=Paenibacillus sp. MDMC362 TaxID=2977365 RepID=UPI0011BECB85|nr:hypothetical protein [Paenibacillus sp. MDMC362]